MRHVTRWSCLALAVFAFSTPLEAQNKPKPGGKSAGASAAEYQQVLGAGEITGKIARVDHFKRVITMQVEVQDVQADAKQAQNAVRQQQQAARNLVQRRGNNNNNNPAQQARQIQQQVAQAQRQQMQALNKTGAGVKTNTVKKEFEFQADEKARVRLMTLPQDFDERGKPKQYTQQELKELKGPNPSVPGYKAEFEDLAVGQTVKLYVAAAGSRRAAPAAPAKGKDVDADNDKNVPVAVDPTKHRATMVLIVNDVEGGSRGKDAPKKKK